MKNKLYNDERLIDYPKIDSQIENEHRHRYYLAAQFATQKIVLDAACGSGYGTSILSDVAQRVIGIDYSSDTIEYCQSHNLKENIEFKQMQVSALEFADRTFDLVVSFETLEHLTEIEQTQFLKEIKRVLKPDGMLIISTPNCVIWERTVNKSKNQYHLNELDKKSFGQLIGKHFKTYSILIQNYGFTSTIIPECIPDQALNVIYSGNWSTLQGAYNIAICTNRGDFLKEINGSIYFPNREQSYIEKELGFCDMELYCDSGNGFCEGDKIKSPISIQNDGKLKVEFEINKDVYAIRFDPGEFPCCIFDFECTNTHCCCLAKNAIEIEKGKYLFYKKDPMFLINTSEHLRKGDSITFTFRYKRLDEEFETLYNENIFLKQQKEEKQIYYNHIEQENTKTNSKYIELQKQLVHYLVDNTRLTNKLNDLEYEIKFRKEKLSSAEDTNDALVQELKEAKKQLNMQYHEINMLCEKLKNFESSRWYRLTKPGRILTGFFRKMFTL